MSSDVVKVVVVDDVIDAADMLAIRLKLDGFQVYTAYSGEQAVLTIEEHLPHCVLLDICMPGMDGCELASVLRHRYKDDVVLIAVTGADETQERVMDAFSLVDHHLLKPVDTKKLRRLLGQ